MKKQAPNGMEAVLADIQAQLRALTVRLDRLEASAPAPVAAPVPAAVPVAVPAAAPAEVPAAPPSRETITEEELLAISAALAAYFGVRVRIRQVRLISSQAWAQQGRVWVQASHRLMH
jgi:methylmalonyl-CoA carboxyltransferase 12S subunit